MKDGVIDRRQFITEVRNTFQLQPWQIALIEAIADGQPEIEPVKHGRWEELPKYGECQCPICGFCTFEAYSDKDCWGVYKLYFRYCPGCGAKMDDGGA